MKKKVAATLLSVILLFNCTSIARADEHTKEYGELYSMYTTGYCYGEITCTGTEIREGICAVKKEWVGMTALVYENDNGRVGQLLGIYECLDTGFGGDEDGDGIGSIQEGKVIDIYFPTEAECYEWMAKTDGKVFVQLVDAKG